MVLLWVLLLINMDTKIIIMVLDNLIIEKNYLIAPIYLPWMLLILLMQMMMEMVCLGKMKLLRFILT